MYLFKPHLWLLLLSVFQIGILKAGNNDLHRRQFKGKVKSDTTYIYYTGERLLKEDLSFIRIARFNKQGNLTADEDLELTYTYGEVSDTDYTHSDFKYDRRGRLVQQMDYSDTELVVKTLKSYNRQGFETEERGYYYTNKIFEKGACKYDSLGNLVEKRWQPIDSLGFRGSDVYQYDSQGNETVNKFIDKSGRVSRIREIKYNEHGAISQTADSTPGSRRQAITDKYIYTRYDATGNWLLRINYYGGQPASIEERVVTYY